MYAGVDPITQREFRLKATAKTEQQAYIELGRLLKEASEGGYHAFSADHGIWSAIGGAGEVLTGSTRDELDRKIRAHWRAMQ